MAKIVYTRKGKNRRIVKAEDINLDDLCVLTVELLTQIKSRTSHKGYLDVLSDLIRLSND